MNARLLVVIALCIVFHPVSAQQSVVIDAFPFTEDFESVVPPALPHGWETSTNRNEDGDFQTNTLGGRNWLTVWHPGVGQFVRTPVFDFTNYRPESISFNERRTGTFQATIIISASTDGGNTFPIVIDSTIYGGNGTREEEFTIPLPPLFINEPEVVFQWEVIPHDVGGASSNVRYEYIRVDAAVQHTHELRVTGVRFTPPLPTTDDRLDATIRILNAGLQSASGFTVGVRSDSEDVLDELFIPDTIEPGDSTTIHLSIDRLFQSIHSLHAYVDYELNEGTQTSLITEVHVAEPVRSYPWIEHFDYFENTLPIQWRTSFHNDTPDASLTTSIVHEGERAVILSNATREQYLILPPFDTSGGVLHGITFFERRTGTFDATMYVDVSTDRGENFEEITSFTHSGETNYVERNIQLDESFSEGDILYVRLRSSGDGTGTTGTIRLDSFGATARMDHDIAVTGIELDPPLPLPGDDIYVDIFIENLGLQPAHDVTVNLYRLENETDEAPLLLGSYDVARILDSGVITVVTFRIEDMPAGYSLLRAEADYPPDIQPENNILQEEIFIRYPGHSLIINEILYHTRDGQPEFVEIYNPGEYEIDLNEWSVRDRETPGGQINRYVLSDTTLIIPSGSFAVLSADSSVFDWFDIDGTEAHFITAGRVALGLSSLGDEVMLLDPSGSVVDSVAYEPSWHHPDVFETRGRSLERISPRLSSNDPVNWSTSADPIGGTPGTHNSIFTETPVTTASIEVHPNPFSPNMDGFEDYTIINYNLPQQTAMVRLRIFDSTGRHVRTLLNNQPSGPHGSVIWDGRNDKGRVARLGIYVILLEAYDSGRGGLTQVKSTVVLADRL